MTKPTIKSPSSSLSQVARPKTQFLIHKKSHPTLYKVSHNSNCSPYLVLTLVRKNAQKNPKVLSLFKNSKKNTQSLGDLADAASTIEQTSNSLDKVASVDKVTSVLQNVEDKMNEAEQQLEFLIQKQKGLVESNSINPLATFSDNDLEAALRSLGEDFSEKNLDV